jgi:hypothetical protein
MTHDHSHSHDHAHTHDHDHDHDHGHDHDHAHDHAHGHAHTPVSELTFEQKLEKLFTHWIDHNDSHKETFFTWAGRAKDANLSDVAQDIEKAGQLSEEVTRILKSALNRLKG